MEKVLQQIISISSKYKQVEQVVLFGSRARGDYRETSDYDLAIQTTEDGRHAFSLLADDIEESIWTLNKFDCLHFNTIGNAILLEIIANEGKVIYTKDEKAIMGY